MFEAVIFDMDGVLIDSEPFWQEAEMVVFETVGIELSHEQAMETVGLRLNEVVEYRYAQQPWAGSRSLEDVRVAILQHLIRRVSESGEAKAGVAELLALLKGLNVRLAVATSSDEVLIEAVMDRLGIGHYFEVIQSAQHEVFGKPHPGVFISAAQQLGVAPGDCLVIEDSLRGIIAAKAAVMWCLAVPDPSLKADPRLILADFRLESLAEFDEAFWTAING